MFQDVNLNDDISTILETIVENNKKSLEVSKKITSLKVVIDDSEDLDLEMGRVESISKTKKIKLEDHDDSYYEDIISLFHSAEADKELIEGLLPDKDNYKYNDILLRLYAESLKDIKEMTEMAREDGTYYEEDVQSFIQSELDKIGIIEELINPTEEDELGEIEHSNKLFLVPNLRGKIRVLDDLDHIPVEFYDEINELIMSIVNGTFKRVKKFYRSSNHALGGVCYEVKGNTSRVLFKRLSHDTYAVISAFLKKTNNDRGYREFIRKRIGDFNKHEDEYKKMLEDNEYMQLNDFYVEELFNKLGRDKDKEYKKVISND